jgi:hypothetical protein
VEISSAQISTQQLVDIVKSPLAADLEITAGQEFIKVLFPIAVTKCGSNEDNIH